MMVGMSQEPGNFNLRVMDPFTEQYIYMANVYIHFITSSLIPITVYMVVHTPFINILNYCKVQNNNTTQLGMTSI